jgi:rRNA-processing protein EBP2
MAPQNKKAKLDHTPTKEKVEIADETVEEDAEPAWIRLEDLEEDDIDDEYGDMVIQQKILVNNEVIIIYKNTKLSMTNKS